MRNIAGDMLHARMQRAFDENPRGDMYRTLTRGDLLNRLKQNIAEVELAMEHGDNDLVDKLADVGNYVAFLLRNYLDPIHLQGGDTLAKFNELLMGVALSRAEGEILIKQIRSRVVQRHQGEGASISHQNDKMKAPEYD